MVTDITVTKQAYDLGKMLAFECKRFEAKVDNINGADTKTVTSTTVSWGEGGPPDPCIYLQCYTNGQGALAVSFYNMKPTNLDLGQAVVIITTIVGTL